MSAGVTVQKKTGTFTTNSSGNATVTCSFVPDLIIIYGSTHNDIEWNMIFSRSEKTSSFTTMACQAQYSTGTYMGQCIVNFTNFSVWIVGYDWDWNDTGAGGSKQFSYCAVKYT